MAQKMEIVLVDDLDGSAADQTIHFALDGATYEIDLSDANADVMRSALNDYVANARKVAGTSGKRRTTKRR